MTNWFKDLDTTVQVAILSIPGAILGIVGTILVALIGQLRDETQHNLSCFLHLFVWVILCLSQPTNIIY